jgi:uncharacterized repeat protein (TIGR03806 family)
VKFRPSLLLAPIFFVAVLSTLHVGCGDTPTEPTDGGAPSPDAPAPVSEFGLDTRPDNVTCVAPERPAINSGVELTGGFDPGVFVLPVQLESAPGDKDTVYVAQLPGKIRKAKLGGPAADFLVFPAGKVNQTNEGGLLGFAFDPKWPATPDFYVSYTNFGGGPANMHSIISRMKSRDGGATIDPASEEVLLDLEQPYTNHNGGGIHFGPDGNLYIGFGDGGSGGDPQGFGQNLNSLLGKMLRIDVRKTQGALKYAIPQDNPFATGGGRAEIYAVGMRNPWRWSFDIPTGTMWVADVGQGAFEEVDVIKRGGNYGWRIREGANCFPVNAACVTKGLVDPIIDYPRADGGSITGGYVYRGTAIPALVGKFIFGDYESGNIWSLEENGAARATKTLLATVPAKTLAAFGQDGAGNLYAMNLMQLLSQTGCTDPANIKAPAPGLIAYSPIAGFWSDGATKDRYMALPNGKTIAIDAAGDFVFPEGTVLVKHFDIGGKRIETRLYIRHSDGVWAGYSYEWNDAQTDATLVVGGKQKPLASGQNWIYPSSGRCQSCHTQAAGFSLGLEVAQLAGTHLYPQTGRVANQLTTLRKIGVFTEAAAADATRYAALVNPFGDGTTVARARSYLHTNCSSCHRPQGGGRGKLDFRVTTPLAATNSCNVNAEFDDFGTANAKILTPKAPADSVMYKRMTATDVKRMPQIGSNVIDAQGAALIEKWIAETAACDAPAP